MKKSCRNFFLIPSSNTKKSILINLKKKTGRIFCLPPFPNIKKSILTNLKKT